MAATEQRCKRATMAATEVIVENCEGSVGSIQEVGDDVFAFVPDDALDGFSADLNEVLTDREFDRAVDSCMDSDFAERWADAVVGADAGRDVREAARRQVCERLFS